ncbi:MAG: SMC-Scp complex subunit ScpB [Pseudothermotoga elfii]
MKLNAIMEALIFASKGMTVQQLAKIAEITEEQAEKALYELSRHYGGEEHGVELKKIGDVYRFYTKPEYSEFVKKIGKTIYSKLSAAQMEIVAAIILNGPSTVQSLNEMRGKDSSAIVRFLHKSGILMRKRHGNSYLYQLSENFKDFLMIEEVLEQFEHLKQAKYEPSSEA